MNVFRKWAMAAVAIAAAMSLPTQAIAQTSAAQPGTQIIGQDSGIWAEKAGVEKIAEGVWASTEEAQMLREYGCALKPLGLVRDFLARQAEKGHEPCSTKWYAGLSKVNKQGSMLSLIKLSFSGYLVAESDKGINLTPNHGQWTLYSLDARSVGRPVYTENTMAPSGAMVTADLFKTVLGSTLNGTGGAFVGGLMNPCRGKGGCGDTWNIQGGSSAAIAANQTEVEASVTTNFDAALNGGTGPCLTCGPTPPSGGGTHTVDGPGSPPYNPGG